jgi:hypothetical protein
MGTPTGRQSIRSFQKKKECVCISPKRWSIPERLKKGFQSKHRNNVLKVIEV